MPILLNQMMKELSILNVKTVFTCNGTIAKFIAPTDEECVNKYTLNIEKKTNRC